MKKMLVLALTGICIAKTSLSQSEELFVHVESNKLFLVHVVAPKENWYSVGRLFNISPKEIAPFNNSTLDKSLSIGQHLEIPLTSLNFTQTAEKSTDETFVAVYHTVRDNETVAKICTAFNNLSPEYLKKWNHLTKEPLKPGTKLVIGYLKVKPALSALATSGRDHIAMTETVTKKEEPPLTSNTPAAREEKKTTVMPPISKPPTNLANTNTQVSGHIGGGYFSVEYNEGYKSTSGTAETFKSTSGWQDGKYYALMNNVAVGTIIKVIAPATQRSVYAKVLGSMPDIKENNGLTVRISNAAASELGEGEFKFNVEIKY